MHGSRDICCRYYTRFSRHRARDDVLPGAVDSTQATTSLPDSIVGRRMACQIDTGIIHKNDKLLVNPLFKTNQFCTCLLMDLKHSGKLQNDDQNQDVLIQKTVD